MVDSSVGGGGGFGKDILDPQHRAVQIDRQDVGGADRREVRGVRQPARGKIPAAFAGRAQVSVKAGPGRFGASHAPVCAQHFRPGSGGGIPIAGQAVVGALGRGETGVFRLDLRQVARQRAGAVADGVA